MIITVFVFGCPGSGKSTAARYIEVLARDLGETWSAIRINDYKILDDWFQADTEHARFRPREYGGFDILVPAVYDEALQVLKRQVHEHTPSRENEFIIIEFARCDYRNRHPRRGATIIATAALSSSLTSQRRSVSARRA